MIDPRSRFGSRSSFILTTMLLFLAAGSAAAQDIITVGTVTAEGPTVDVPVYIRDVAGTPLGNDRPAGSKIQSFSIKVMYSPASAISSVTFARAGITANLSPTLELTPTSAGAISLLATFQESSNPIPFSNAGGSGNLVAHLLFTLSPTATPGTSIALSIDGGLTQLTDAGGTAATKETEANGGLSLVDGAIDIPVPSLSITPSSAEVAAGGTTTLRVSSNRGLIRASSVTLSSSDPNVATVPISMTIGAGAKRIDVPVTGVAVGTATINATFPSAMGGSTTSATVTVGPAEVSCSMPLAPVVSAPATAGSGAAYSITWLPVAGATEYIVDEATAATFADATSTTVTGTTTQFTHSVSADARHYYRVRARNRATDCDVTGAASNVASVLVQAVVAPVQAMRVLPVVGSTGGDQGSFFRTSMQLFNPHDAAVSGVIVLHRSGSPDATLAYSLAPGKSIAWDDLLLAMGTNGIGTADILGDVGSAMPVSSVRVFNDAGAAGTTGLNEEAMRVEDALETGETGAIIAPADFTRFRLNVGIRTLQQGAAISVVVRDADGVVLKTVERSYPATFFGQLTSGQFLDGLILEGGESLTFTMASGSAFIYGATTDNRTNDPAMQLVRPRE